VDSPWRRPSTADAGPRGRADCGGERFALGDTLVTFERRDGTVARLRLDSGTGHNVLARH